MRQSNVVVGVKITLNFVHLQSKSPIDSSKFSIAPAMEWPSKMLFLSTDSNEDWAMLKYIRMQNLILIIKIQ